MKQHEDIVYACSSLKAIHATKRHYPKFCVNLLSGVE